MMYVDDSGSPDLKDRSGYYVISGVIIHELHIRNIEVETQYYKENNFGKYNNCEIHVSDIFNETREFKGIEPVEKYKILDSLYDFIEKLEMTVISVGIDKVEIVERYTKSLIFTYAWTQLIERFNSFISDNGNNQNKGLVITDKSSKLPENDIINIINDLRASGTDYIKVTHLVEEPIFIESKLREGIQLADASAYCTLKYLSGYTK